MRYPHYPGVSERLRRRLIERGYVRLDGELDIARFLAEHRHYDPRSFYPWLKDRTPSPAKLAQLARDLDVSVAWLLLGDERPTPPRPARSPRRRPVPIAGGSAQAQTPGVAQPLDLLPLIGSWLRDTLCGKTFALQFA